MTVEVARDGSLVAAEDILFAFSGPFSGGCRDIPLREGESISWISPGGNLGAGASSIAIGDLASGFVTSRS
ncbi:hypothetical protein Gocc_2980 [Gaiella occulta]|uniref:Uncharacterized protein n=1 Tax=Gaiella occulta TaxID=1002870 RepID=A0A7M2YUG2_9ACTN|nr:hypothetical protein [Gaiella occulta]RDI73380.1 hypothetical protein Gocc_2980 [Gaiella occulta]